MSLAEAFALVEDSAENHGQECAGTDDERDVARGRKRKGCIFCPEIERASGDAANKQEEFVLPAFATELAVPYRKEYQVGDGET